MFNLQYTFTEQANKFHTLTNLTNWHFSSRKDLNEYLIGKYGSLSKSQKEALVNFKNLLGKKASGSDFIGNIFFEEGFKFEYCEFERILSKKQFEELVAIFDSLDPWWQEVWAEEKNKLGVWKGKLEQKETHEQNLNIIADLETFYSHNPNNTQTVFLLISAPHKAGGGVNVGKDKITLECGGFLIDENLGKVLGVLWHEVGHIFSKHFVGNVLNPYLRETKMSFLDNSKLMKITGGFRVSNYFREAIVYCLFSSGYLGEKYFGKNIDKSYEAIFEKKISKAPLRWKWSVLVRHNLSSIAGKYIEQGKKIDKQFLSEVETTLKEFTAFVEQSY